MIRKSTPLLLIATLWLCLANAQSPIGIGEWRTHLPYRNATSIADAGDKVYCAANVFFFSYDKSTGIIRRFDKVSGLSDLDARILRYNEGYDILFVGYENTNIDLLKGNTIINISDIKRKQIVGEKVINDVIFEGNFAYLSCSFGIVVLDLEKEEVKDTYVIGAGGQNVAVNAFAFDDDYYYAATDEGLKVASRNVANLANYQEWQGNGFPGLPIGPTTDIVAFDTTFFVVASDTIFKLEGSQFVSFYVSDSHEIRSVNAENGYLIVGETLNSNEYDGQVNLLDSLGNENVFSSQINVVLDADFDKNGVLWLGDFINTLVKVDIEDRSRMKISPNGPWQDDVRRITAYNGEVWVAPGGISTNFGYTNNADGFFHYDGNEWLVVKESSGIPEMQELYNIIEVERNPANNTVYFGTYWAGLLEVNSGQYELFDSSNSTLTDSQFGDPDRTKITGLTFDSESNLWVSNYEGEDLLSVKTSDGSWYSYKPSFGIDNHHVGELVVDDANQKWILVVRSNDIGLLVFNHGADLQNTGDDAFVQLRSGNSGLHTNNVYSIVKDKDGEIWVGTDQGISVFYCASSVFTEQGCQAQRILVTNEDGFTAYLLESEAVRCLAVDGADRKWAGTSNGLFLLSPDGTEQLAHFTTDNSPLLSDNVLDVAIDPITGEVFIGTDRGIVSYRAEATEGGEEHGDVVVFPNPVREDYDGPIAVRGLVNNADVKFTDVAGNLFYQTTAFGGQAVWDGRNYNGEKAKTGVYLIFSSNEDGSSTNVAKVLIVR